MSLSEGRGVVNDFLSLCRIMIFDVARHKFSEGLLTLFLFAFMATVALFFVGEVVPLEMAAPLRSYIDSFAVEYPTLSKLLIFPIIVYSGLRLSRATVRVGIYSSSSLAAISLSAVAMFACVTSENYLATAVVVLLISEVLGRMLYCFGANMQLGYLFTSMLALGAMPLVDSALIPVVALLSVVALFVRGTWRETAIVFFGVATPSFLYCYVMWLLGGDFGELFVDIWRGVVSPGQDSISAFMTLSHLIFLGVTALLTLCSVIAYCGVRVTFVDSVRVIWRLLIALIVVLVAMLFLLPSASPSIIVAMVLVMTVMLPQLFMRVDVVPATLLYILYALSAFVAIL